jgi:hypothetical protein
MRPYIVFGNNNRLNSAEKAGIGKIVWNHGCGYARGSSLQCLKDDTAMHKMASR